MVLGTKKKKPTDYKPTPFDGIVEQSIAINELQTILGGQYLPDCQIMGQHLYARNASGAFIFGELENEFGLQLYGSTTSRLDYVVNSFTEENGLFYFWGTTIVGQWNCVSNEFTFWDIGTTEEDERIVNMVSDGTVNFAVCRVFTDEDGVEYESRLMPVEISKLAKEDGVTIQLDKGEAIDVKNVLEYFQ